VSKAPLTDDWLVSLEFLPLEDAKRRVLDAGYRPHPIPETIECPPYLGRDVVILRHTEGAHAHVTGARAGDSSQIRR
jgi:hypothetical protein